MTMEESSSLDLQAKDLLTSPSHEGAELLVGKLMNQETKDYEAALALYDFCTDNFPNCLTLMLLNVYRYSSNSFIRHHSIYLLSETLAGLRGIDFDLSRVALHEIKPLLISCLEMQENKESDFKFLRRIISFVAYDVMICDNGGWLELSDCILWLANTEPLKAFHVFVELPTVYGTFIFNFMEVVVEEAEKVLVNPEKSGVEGWSLALETVVKMGIQLLDSEMRLDLIKNLLNILEKSVKELVEKGMEQFLVQGLYHLERFLSRDNILYNYNKDQCVFVLSFMFKIKDLCTLTKEIVKKINKLVKVEDSGSQQTQDRDSEYDRDLFYHLKTLSSLDILKIVASGTLQGRSRELAVRQLEVVLSDHTSMKMEIDISVMRQLQPLLISCLWEEGISDSMFKVLGQVVYHVANEMMYNQEVKWQELRDYIALQSKTEFEKAVYIFQCLSMPLEDDEFVVNVLDYLLPEIITRLTPPRELLIDNSSWVLAFTGAFCAAINLIDITSHTESVREVLYKMINSVKELVERRMEIGLVRRAFRDLETIVKKQLEWYNTSEYKFLKVLLWMLYAIKGMKWESKIVLWRINVILERGVDNDKKNLPENWFAWLNA